MSDENTSVEQTEGGTSEAENQSQDTLAALEAQAGLQTEPTETSEQSNDWFYSDGVKGEGERPEWLINKYKTVEAQAKGYNEIRKQLGGFTGAPKDGYSLEKFGEDVNSEHELFENFNQIAKDLNMSQEGYENLVGLFMEHEKKQQQETDQYLNSLTEKDHQELGVLQQWAKNNFSEEEFATLDSWATNKESVELLKKFRSLMTKPSHTPTANTTPNPITREQIAKEMSDNYDRYLKDADYRERINALRAKLG